MGNRKRPIALCVQIPGKTFDFLASQAQEFDLINSTYFDPVQKYQLDLVLYLWDPKGEKVKTAIEAFRKIHKDLPFFVLMATSHWGDKKNALKLKPSKVYQIPLDHAQLSAAIYDTLEPRMQCRPWSRGRTSVRKPAFRIGLMLIWHKTDALRATTLCELVWYRKLEILKAQKNQHFTLFTILPVVQPVRTVRKKHVWNFEIILN